MKRRLAIYGTVLILAAIFPLRAILFPTRAETYAEASAAEQHEIDAINRLHFERALIQRGERLDSTMAAKLRAASAVLNGTSRAMSKEDARRRMAEPQAQIDRQLDAIDREIAAQQVRVTEAEKIKSSLAP
jgi:hypothetical protein